jgi:cellulose synthase/poly-beta-1,6-N-acetylglucosamine synthase-like glycosyltransferase
MKVFIAIPSMNELESLPLLLKDLKAQTYGEFEILVCVNNPEEWWYDPSKAKVCENNMKTMELLKTFTGIKISAIDRTSKGNGWKGKKKGVGYARKELFEAIDRLAKDDDIVISLDADTRIKPAFVDSVRNGSLSTKRLCF